MSGIVEKAAEVRFISPEGLYLIVEGRGYFAAFRDFPYLADLRGREVFDLEYCGNGHIRWDAADIDLSTEILSAPEKFPLVMHPAANPAAQLGKRGGAVRSGRKAAASRSNGAKGGRPAKKKILA
ncbi:DUF2442 domain-containing protein [Victivallis sp. Marseille-Q1083]|uniref:DUF2442 domain-containing protein n=1 Tax=Victivallis sp. Marseille-Q1083 TaxID=2717288 RepID=UPI00158CEFF5|nr:DUF2442 domain-containing protein [Victivallis sp. Marseille-Q1083]